MGKLFERIFGAVVLAGAVILAGGTVLLRATAEPATEPVKAAAPAPTVSLWTSAPAAAEEPAATPTPTAEPEYFSLSFVGDCTLASNVYQQGGPLGYDTVVGDDYAYPFAKTVQYFADDDFTFANLEVALTKSGAYSAESTFFFKADPDYAKILTEGSVELVSLANNHTYDLGQQGYNDTIAAVEAEGIAWAGMDGWTVYETDRGLKIGVYAAFYDKAPQITAKVKQLREAGADLVIAYLHRGTEGTYHADSIQKELSHAAVDAGADFVFGSHPHTLQPVEEYKGVTIYYSLGNWTFGGNTTLRDKDTVIVHMTVARYADGSVEIVDIENIPCAASDPEQDNNYQPVPYEEGSEEYARVLSKLDGSFDGPDLTVNYN